MVIDVDDTKIHVVRMRTGDYFSLTNIIKANSSKVRVSDWLRTKRTLMMMFEWEEAHNGKFNGGEFATIMQMVDRQGVKNFKLSASEWIERTRAIGLMVTEGRDRGTYGQRDIALDFAGWVNPFFRRWLGDAIRRRVDGELKF
jgi:hypothetical protein